MRRARANGALFTHQRLESTGAPMRQVQRAPSTTGGTGLFATSAPHRHRSSRRLMEPQDGSLECTCQPDHGTHDILGGVPAISDLSDRHETSLAWYTAHNVCDAGSTGLLGCLFAVQMVDSCRWTGD